MVDKAKIHAGFTEGNSLSLNLYPTCVTAALIFPILRCPTFGKGFP